MHECECTWACIRVVLHVGAHVFVPVGVQRRGVPCLLLHMWVCVQPGVQWWVAHAGVCTWVCNAGLCVGFAQV